MDELEFRRRLLADPHDPDPELLAAKQESNANRAFSDELDQLDTLIEQTLRVDVPDDLVDKVLFKQSSNAEREKNRPRFHLAIAASVAFAFGVMLGQFNWTVLPSAQESLGHIALQHYYDESGFIGDIYEGASLQQVNAKLTPLGSQFSGPLPGKVAYLNHCGFGDKHALHMVVSTASGQDFTVFVVPKTTKEIEKYSDGKMDTVTIPTDDQSIIVVGESGSDITPLAEELIKSLNQKA